MKLPDAGFQMKKGWERLTHKRRWNKPFPASIQSSNLPQGETANSYDRVWRRDLQKPCNQNKKYPNKSVRMVGSWHSHWEWNMPYKTTIVCTISGYTDTYFWRTVSIKALYFRGQDLKITCFSCLLHGVQTRTHKKRWAAARYSTW